MCYENNVFIVIERKDFNDADIERTNLSLMLIPPLQLNISWFNKIWGFDKKQGSLGES